MLSLVRGIAVSLVLAGFFAAVHSQPSQPKATATVAVPVPVCPPNDPNACHIDQWGK